MKVHKLAIYATRTKDKYYICHFPINDQMMVGWFGVLVGLLGLVSISRPSWCPAMFAGELVVGWLLCFPVGRLLVGSLVLVGRPTWPSEQAQLMGALGVLAGFAPSLGLSHGPRPRQAPTNQLFQPLVASIPLNSKTILSHPLRVSNWEQVC